MKQIIRRVAAVVIGLGLGAVALAGLETVTHIQDLNASWPLGSDLASTSDDHLRNIKSALKTDFPNFNGTYNSAAAPVFAIPNDTNTGMYGPSADNLAWATGGTQRAVVNSTGNWTFNAPSSGIALAVNGVGSSYSGLFTGGGSAGTQKGLSVVTTTQNASDRIINVNNSLSNLFDIFGDGHGDLGPNLSWATTGNWTIGIPTSGVALSVTGISGSAAAIITGGSTASSSIGLVIRAGTNSGDTGFQVSNYNASVDYLRVAGNGAIQGGGPVAGALVDMTPDTGTFTATANSGLTTTPTATVTWSRVGKLVILEFGSGLSGTSNSTSFSATGLPAAIQPATLSQSINLADTVDNSIHGSAGSVVISAGSGTMNFSRNASLTGWTSSGTKSIAVGSVAAYLLN